MAFEADVVQAFKGLRWAGSLFGGPVAKPVRQRFKASGSGKLTHGDVLQLDTNGELLLATSTSARLLGMCHQTLTTVDSVTEVPVIVGPDSVFAVYDTDARVVGVEARITGATGDQSLQFHATNSNNTQFYVCWPSDGHVTYVAFKAQSHLLLQRMTVNAS